MIFHFSVEVHFVFLLMEFHCNISIYYKILPYYVYYCIFDWVAKGLQNFYIRPRCTSFHTHASHFVTYYSFSLFLCVSVWENTLA